MTDGFWSGTIELPVGNETIEAYRARPDGDEPRGGVVVIHHLPGYDRGTKEITRRLAELGYDAICPNLYHRDAPGKSPDEASAIVRAQGGVPDDRLVQDVAATAEFLREDPGSNGRVGVIGFCSGGRHAFLAGCRTPVDAVVDCYGGFVTRQPPADHPLRVVVPLLHLIDGLQAPVLGLFGNDDSSPSPHDVDVLEESMREHGKSFEVHRYDGAAHGFLGVDRAGYRWEAAQDAWQRIAAFFTRTLGGPPGASTP